MMTTSPSVPIVPESSQSASQNINTEAPLSSSLATKLSSHATPVAPDALGIPTPRRRRHQLLGWVLRGFVIGLLALGIAVAIPASRNYLTDLVLYQGGDLFAAPEAHTVERVVHVAWGTIKVQVPVMPGRLLAETFSSSILSRQPTRTMYIYLPPGYNAPQNRQRRYPVVYLLHGAPGSSRDWWRGAQANIIADEMIAAGLIQPVILAMPDGNGGQWRDTEYVNSWNGKDREMDYLVHGVVPWVDSHFRTIADGTERALGGMSMGGYGAYNVGLHYPTVWRTLFSIGGYFAADPGEVFGANDPLGHDPRFLRANSPIVYVGRVPGVRQMHLLIEDSTADWGGYTQKAEAFASRLTQLGIPHTLEMHHPTGLVIWDHSWAYWKLALRQALVFCNSAFGH